MSFVKLIADQAIERIKSALEEKDINDESSTETP